MDRCRNQINTENLGKFDLALNGKTVLNNEPLTEAVKEVERISFRTGEYRNLPNRTTPNQKPSEPLPGADEKVTKSIFFLDEVSIQ